METRRLPGRRLLVLSSFPTQRASSRETYRCFFRSSSGVSLAVFGKRRRFAPANPLHERLRQRSHRVILFRIVCHGSSFARAKTAFVSVKRASPACRSSLPGWTSRPRRDPGCMWLTKVGRICQHHVAPVRLRRKSFSAERTYRITAKRMLRSTISMRL